MECPSAESLLAISPLDGRYQRDLDPLRPFFSEQALIKNRIRVELRFLKALLQILDKEIPAGLLDFLEQLEHRPELVQAVKAQEEVTRHDVKAVEYALAEALTAEGFGEWINWLHWGLTSEDVNNLAYGLMLSESYQSVLLPTLKAILRTLNSWIGATEDIAMLARTHGQAASPTTVGKEYAVFASRLLQEIRYLEELLPVGGKLNGATGNWHVFQTFFPEHNWQRFSRHMIESLGLKAEMLSTQIATRQSYSRVLDTTNRINQILIDLSRDSWHYISLSYFRLKQRSRDEVGSSTMPHKINPVMFENAEGNLEIATSLLDLFSAKLLKSRLQRDLSDSTVLRNLGVGLGHSLVAWINLQRGLNQLEAREETLKNELANHWEVLAEPLQHALRLQGKTVPYDLIRKHTQGLQMSEQNWQSLIKELDIEFSSSPQTYTGLAAELAHQVYLEIEAYLHQN